MMKRNGTRPRAVPAHIPRDTLDQGASRQGPGRRPGSRKMLSIRGAVLRQYIERPVVKGRPPFFSNGEADEDSHRIPAAGACPGGRGGALASRGQGRARERATVRGPQEAGGRL